MTKKRIHFIVLIISMLLCGIMLLDASIMPSAKTEEIITNGRERSTLVGANLYRSFYISTAQQEYEIREGFYLMATVGQPLVMHRSIITRARQKISYEKDGIAYAENLGFAREPAGFAFLCIMLLFSLGIMIFYKRLTHPYAISNACIFVSVVSLLFFYFHLR